MAFAYLPQGTDLTSSSGLLNVTEEWQAASQGLPEEADNINMGKVHGNCRHGWCQGQRVAWKTHEAVELHCQTAMVWCKDYWVRNQEL